jgi:5S rRNA maturation endonuclease (ribonuclease M5)
LVEAAGETKKISLSFPLKERHLHLAERLYAMYQPGELETDPSKIAYTIKYGTTKEIPRFSFAFELIAIPLNIDKIRRMPYAIKSEFHGLVNSSYAALGTRFDGSYRWVRKKNGREAYEENIIGVLQQCGFTFSSLCRNSKNKIPCAILGNLISQRVDYTEKSKAKMDASPFVDTIIKAVEKVASKVQTYKAIGISFAGDSDKYRVSSRPRASTYYIKNIVEMMLLPRIRKVKAGGKIDTEQTQDSLWYNALPLFKKYDVKYSNDSREWFKTCIRTLCKEHGVAREQIGILAAPWGVMFFKGQWFDISFDTIKELANKGTDILFIEKRDIVMALGKYASKVGVALVNTHGILSDYTEDLAELADISGAHVAIFTDYDIPGILIASALKENVPRLGVDERMLDYFDMNDKEDPNIVVPYNPKVTRLKDYNLRRLVTNDKRFSPDMIDIEFLKHEKIEIDAVLAAQGAEKLWQYLQGLLEKEFPKRDYLRVIDPAPDLSKHYPPIIQRLKLYYHKIAHEITEPERKKIEEELKEVDGFIDVEQKEKEILDDRLGKIVTEHQLLKDVAETFVALDREKGYRISEIEIPRNNDDEDEAEEDEGSPSPQLPPAPTTPPTNDDNIPDPPVSEQEREIAKRVGLKPATYSKYKLIQEHGTKSMRKELKELEEDEDEYSIPIWEQLVDELYRELIDEEIVRFGRIPKDEEEEVGGGSEK